VRGVDLLWRGRRRAVKILLRSNSCLYLGTQSQPSVFLEDPVPLLVHRTTPPPSLSPHLFTILLPDVNEQDIGNSLCEAYRATEAAHETTAIQIH